MIFHTEIANFASKNNVKERRNFLIVDMKVSVFIHVIRIVGWDRFRCPA